MSKNTIPLPSREELEALVATEEYPIISLPEPPEGEEAKNRSGRKGLHPLIVKHERLRALSAAKLALSRRVGRSIKGETEQLAQDRAEAIQPGGPEKLERRKKKEATALRQKAAVEKMQIGAAKKRREMAIIRAKMDEGILLTSQEVGVLNIHGNKHDKMRVQNQTADTIIGTKDVKELRAIVEQTAAKYMYNPIEELIRTSLHLDRKGKPMGEDMPRIDAKEKMNIDKALLPYLVAQVPPQKAQDSGSSSESKGVQVFINQIEFDGPINRPLAGVEPLHLEKPKMVETTIVQRD
tara:strand:- start:6532 stop:7416 length:885 start_codon:yes stop_codon:yes gene_type:complete